MLADRGRARTLGGDEVALGLVEPERRERVVVRRPEGRLPVPDQEELSHRQRVPSITRRQRSS